MNRLTRRRAAPEDEAFLFDLFRHVRGDEFALTGLPPAQLDILLQMQFRAQSSGYRSQYPDSDHEIVLVDDAAAGRIWVRRSPAEFVLVDISLLPSYRNRGIGTALLTELIDEARSAGAPLRCSVALTNQGSLRLHQRLGFAITGQDEVYCDLERKP
jgi:ribosomal protein S18 acetylase RimI-like enzyme